MSEDLRICGECNKPKIPRGVDWPLWKDGKPVCLNCHLFKLPLPAQLPLCPACGGICGVTPFLTVSCVECPYDAGGHNDTEADAIRAHMLNCQRLAMLVPVQPDGWKLVPRQGVTLEMQRAYFKVIDENMPRLNDHRDSFGRHDANRLAYSAMIEAAPEWKPPTKDNA